MYKEMLGWIHQAQDEKKWRDFVERMWDRSVV